MVFNWAIRGNKEELIGGIGFAKPLEIGKANECEIGYWLAKPYWGRGIMTDVVKRFCQVAFKDFNLARVTATVFSFNAASARVLEKCDFRLEAELEKHHLKDGKFVDARLYAKRNPGSANSLDANL